MGIALAFVALGFVTMAMPGTALFLLGDLPFGARMAAIPGERLPELGMWTHLLWPWAVPLAWAIDRRLQARGRVGAGPWARRLRSAGVYLVVLSAWAVAVAAFLHSLLPSQP